MSITVSPDGTPDPTLAHTVKSGGAFATLFDSQIPDVATAAKAQQEHRLSRVKAWEEKKVEVMAKVRESGITVDESVAEKFANYTTSNAGRGPQIMVDATLQRDLAECFGKIKQHRASATEYSAWVQVLEANPEARLKLATTAKLLIESRGHNMTRAEVYDAVLGSERVSSTVPTFKQWVGTWIGERARLRDVAEDQHPFGPRVQGQRRITT